MPVGVGEGASTTEETPAVRRQGPVSALLVVALLGVLAGIYRALVAGRVLSGGDLELYFYPYWAAVVRALKAGQLPLWNPYLFAGAPLLANSQVGVFYPLNWPLWALATRSLDGVTRALHASVLLHVALAGVNAFLLARATRLSRRASVVVGLVFAGSGYLVTHLEHLNQLQAAAWLPLLFLPWRTAGRRRLFRGLQAPLPRGLSVAAMAMILLAGHTQMAFIAVIGVAVWSATTALIGQARMGAMAIKPSPRASEGAACCAPTGPGGPQGTGGDLSAMRREAGAAETKDGAPVSRRRDIGRRLLGWGLGLGPFAIAGLVAAVQLAPTWELAGLSGRGGGLDWREAVSFSVPPWSLHRVLLPPYLFVPLLPEGVGYLGLSGLLLAGLGLWRAVRQRDRQSFAWAVLGGVGLLLALGGYNPLYLLATRLHVPGFAHFRAPARFLALSTLAGAWLAGVGAEGLWAWLATVRMHVRSGRHALAGAGWAAAGFFVVVAVVGADLAVAAGHMPLANATTPRAYTDLRPATAQLVSAAVQDAPSGSAARFLSISQTLFEVGDKQDIEIAYAGALSDGALYAYLVSAKQREVLVPNLPLAFAVPAADGYDGGLLPTRYYMDFSELLLPGGTPDGRLREVLKVVPETRWLDLMGVRYLVTDKTADAWVDDIFYDRQFSPSLGEGETLPIAWVPDSFPADGVGLLYAGAGGLLRVTLGDGRHIEATLPPRIAAGQSYRVAWDGATPVAALTITGATGGVQLSGLSLLDDRTGAFYPLTLSGVFRLVHSGDVKIYEQVTPPSRAFFVTACQAAASPPAALALLGDPAFDPLRAVVVAADRAGTGGGCAAGSGTADTAAGAAVSFLSSDATHVVLDVETTSPGYLVLGDAWYPGWRARLERLDAPSPGEAPSPVSDPPVLRADLLFRAVALQPGHWRVTFSYAQHYLVAGAIASLLGLLALLGYARYTGRRPS